MRRQVVVLDDYQHVAHRAANWSLLDGLAEVTMLSNHLANPDELVERLQPFAVIVANRERTAFPAAVLERLPNLELLITTGQSNPSIDIDSASALGITVCGTRSPRHPTAELTWALILACVKQIIPSDAGVRDGRWQTTMSRDLAGARLGVVGLGTQGAAVARIGMAFGMQVAAWSQNLTIARCEQLGVRRLSKSELLRESDVVTLHVVLSERTRGLIGASDLRSMKRSAFLVNTSRGPIVDEPALVEAVSQGWIAGAGLDVFDTEPLPLDHPLRSLKQVILSPHMGYVTEETYEIYFQDAVEDILAFYQGTPLRMVGKQAPATSTGHLRPNGMSNDPNG